MFSIARRGEKATRRETRINDLTSVCGITTPISAIRVGSGHFIGPRFAIFTGVILAEVYNGYKSRYVQMENKERLTCLSYRRFPIPYEQILRFYGEQLRCVKVAAVLCR